MTPAVRMLERGDRGIAERSARRTRAILEGADIDPPDPPKFERASSHWSLNANTELSATTKMRPLATIGVWNLLGEPTPSLAPPPVYTGVPSSPLKPTNRPPAIYQTMLSFVPSVVVEIGDEVPL